MINYSEKLDGEPTKKAKGFPILDSRLITPTISKKYDIKLVECGDYIQVYYYENSKSISPKKDTTDLELKKQKLNKIFNENEEQKEINKNDLIENKIELRNIIRSKLTCQRIAKSNTDKWETFITLTFEDNITEIKTANKKFRYFIDKVRRIKKDFSYIAIPEFQKRGAIHYHLLTNIGIDDEKLIYSQEDNPKFKHIKYWNDGFTSIEIIKGDMKKVVGYISKYMTKDIDNRLFGFRRFLYSQNLILPKSSYIDVNDERDFEFYQQKIQGKELIYQSDYINPYDNTTVSFLEFNN